MAPSHTASNVNWNEIDCVFLDMDGTLLDLNYDNHVWNNLVPRAYAAHHGLSYAAAQEKLLNRMREIYGTIDFYSFDYWIEFTGIDLVAAHEQAAHRLAYRSGARAFLRWLQQSGYLSVIATNAHPESIRVKNNHTAICSTVDAVVSSHHFAAPKEADAYWQGILAEYPYDPQRCLFIDDNEPVLDSAARCGIGHLLAVATPDSTLPARANLRYPSFNDFAEICPAITEPNSTARGSGEAGVGD